VTCIHEVDDTHVAIVTESAFGIAPCIFKGGCEVRFHGVARSSSSMKVTSRGCTARGPRSIDGWMSCGDIGWIDARNSHWSGCGRKSESTNTPRLPLQRQGAIKLPKPPLGMVS
jgi:hypothetical protein